MTRTPEEQKLRDENIQTIREWEEIINADLDEQLRQQYGTIVMYLVRAARFVYFNVFGRRKY